MTWSIVARDSKSGAFGVAVTTKFFGVGALCPYVASGIGAVATQALVNPTFGPRGLQLLATRMPAPEVVNTLLANDDGRAVRQLHVIDGAGRIAAHTGANCLEWCGQIEGDGASVAGNTLAGPEVVSATLESYQSRPDRAFADRLLSALEAGQAAGGDKRGKQSAALLIHTTEDYPYLDLRVDDHPNPLVELRRLYVESRRQFLPFLHFLPTRSDPAGVYDRAMIDDELPRIRDALGD